MFWLAAKRHRNNCPFGAYRAATKCASRDHLKTAEALGLDALPMPLPLADKVSDHFAAAHESGVGPTQTSSNVSLHVSLLGVKRTYYARREIFRV
jgi:hypothetical protein